METGSSASVGAASAAVPPIAGLGLGAIGDDEPTGATLGALPPAAPVDPATADNTNPTSITSTAAGAIAHRTPAPLNIPHDHEYAVALELADVPEETPAGGVSTTTPSRPAIVSPKTSYALPGGGGSGSASASALASRRASASGQPLSPRLRSPCASPRPSSRARPTSALVSGLVAAGAVPKPRSNSSLQSSRPAPPSPVSSRPQSQVLSSPGMSPRLSPRSSPGPLSGLGIVNANAGGVAATISGASSGSAGGSPGSAFRDRAGSLSSTTRRIRPRSTLGATSLIPPAGTLAEIGVSSSDPPSPHRLDDPSRTPSRPGTPGTPRTPRGRGASINVASLQRASGSHSSLDASSSVGVAPISPISPISPVSDTRPPPADYSPITHSPLATATRPIDDMDVDAVEPVDKGADVTTVPAPDQPPERDAAAEAEQETAGERKEAPGLAVRSGGESLPGGILVRRVIVRDYAFPLEDERFVGLGPHRSRSNWCEGEPEPEEPPEPAKPAWGLSLGLGSWGFLSRREGEGGGSGEAGSGGAGGGGHGGAVGPGDDTDYIDGTTHDNDAYWSEDDEDDEFGGDDDDPDGLFRAAYAFEPEGVNEMAVEVGDLLDVRGRGGGGDGWVVAIRLDTGAEGLVPEGYLERVDREECPEGWEHLTNMRRQASAAPSDSPAEMSGANDSDEE